ncbi:hypothetical protein [Sabulicella rubraurantiaca]|uniref:hypothetical protein n=1 Tax=Sabulicella rubraurantiaca TaxID=2811429 RepID=UPI001F3EE6DC|nr:hypothetical protein [Sabulicella rubraurantiaca]
MSIRTLNLNLFIYPDGHHEAAWRHPASEPERITDLSWYQADQIKAWSTQGAADGFNVMPPWLPGGFKIFADEVVPILRRRGLFREEYAGTTLRDHLGLPRPESLFAAAQRRLAS